MDFLLSIIHYTNRAVNRKNKAAAEAANLTADNSAAETAEPVETSSQKNKKNQKKFHQKIKRLNNIFRRIFQFYA